jgi:mono/diheme cytochrome c family protein
VSLAVIASTAVGDDDDEQPPGLVGRYQVNQSAVERVDPDIAFRWDQASPDERLPAGKFTADWSGTLLLRSEETYQFHAYMQGRVQLKVNGLVVLDVQSDSPQWLSGPPVKLSFGDQPFELSYVRTGDAGQLKLYWSSGDFPLEPLPSHALFQKGPSPQLTLVERGRQLFESNRCAACHAGPKVTGIEPLAAPSLKHVGIGTTRDWLIQKLTSTGESDQVPSANTRMPHFGFNRDDADAIIAALQAGATPVDWIAPPKLKDTERAKDLQAGETLIRSVGCLACHSWKSLGEVTPFGGGSLDGIAMRRSSNWLTTWLADPAKVNPRHRMPVVPMSDRERAQIVLALGSTNESIDVKVDFGDKAQQTRGRQLIAQARCVSCHDLPWESSQPAPLVALNDPKVDWDRSCLQSLDRSKNQPGFVRIDNKAVRAWLSSWPTRDKPVAAIAMHLVGQRLLEQKNCLSCHDRDTVRGLSRHAAAIAKADESLIGQQMTLIPPRLNAVGDRMYDAALSEAIRGEQKSLRLPWLRVRMPRFAHSRSEQSSIMETLVSHDRIPDGSPNSGIATRHVPETADAQSILSGRELLGGKGFSCVACHSVKDYTPKVTALGTRGSNLHLIGQRMRTDYFFRWTRAPLRIMPGVEMPNYQRAHEFILPGQLDRQLVSIWQALNDPSLTSPTNPAVVEQLLAVGNDDAPRVVRDVFTVPGSDETIARSYAAGLPGGHSLLLDLETASVRAWTLGDFARQRCEGKRWYWDLAGTVLATGFDKQPDLVLVHNDSRELIAPETGWAFECWLKSEPARSRDGLRFDYEVRYTRDGVTHRLPLVQESLTGNGRGVSRRILIKPSGSVWPWFRKSAPAAIHSAAKIAVLTKGVDELPALPGAIRFEDGNRGMANFSMSYENSLDWANPAQNPSTPPVSRADQVTSVPGFRGERLPLIRSIMPTALAWDRQQRLLFTSLKGHVYRYDPKRDGARGLMVVEEGLAAPFGIIDDPLGPSPGILVSHKPELLRLNLDRDDRVESRQVVATGWGITDDYHDWTCGIARDSQGNLFLGLGSDYTFKNRPASKSRWRGDILRITRSGPDGADGNVESIARGLRYPTGLAIDDQDRLFASDQQGVQNTFNEFDFIQVGHRYGVPSRHEVEPNAPADSAAVQIPHPWTRSVNGIVFVPRSRDGKLSALSGHVLGVEMNNNMLIRISLQTVGNVVQGAVYPFSKPGKAGEDSNFLGPLCIGISPTEEVYVGSLQDGGWAGGLNTGDIVKLTPIGELPNGIREIRATRDGFDIEFFQPVDRALATRPGSYKISGYTRVWKGDYATPDSGHHAVEIPSVIISDDGRTVSLNATGRKVGHVYDVSVSEIGTASQRALWPAIGHFTLHSIPDSLER